MMRATVSTAAILAAVSVVCDDGQAQTLEESIGQVRNGIVRMSYAAREGVCGWGGNGNVTISSSSRGSDDWESDCDRGPVRVLLRIAGGQINDIDTHIGGRWRSRGDRVDLGNVPAAAAAEYMLDLASTLDGDVGKDAVFAAYVADSAVVWRDFVRIARDESRPSDIRETAVFWLGDIPDEAVVGALADMLESSMPGDIKEKAVFALSRHDSGRASRLLRDLAADDEADRELRERAIFWLGQTREEDEAAFLKGLYSDISDSELRERVLFSVSQMRNMDSENWLVDVALDDGESMELREKAIFWLGQMRGASRRLIDLYDRVPGDDLRERLIFAYSQKRNDDAALDKLMDIARNDPSRELRRKAIFWLGQSRDARAVDFLAELIR